MPKLTVLSLMLLAAAASAWSPALLCAATGTPYDPYADKAKKQADEAKKKVGTAMEEVPPLDPEVIKQIQAAQNMGILDSQTQQTLQGVIEGDYTGAQKTVEYKKGIDIQKNEESRIKKFSTPLEKKPLSPPGASDKMGGLNLPRGKLRPVDFGDDKKDDEKLRPKTFAGQQSGNTSGSKGFNSGGGFVSAPMGTSSGGGPPGAQAGKFHPMQRREISAKEAGGAKSLQPMTDPFTTKREAKSAQKTGAAPTGEGGPLAPDFAAMLGEPGDPAGAKKPASAYAEKEAAARAVLAKDPKNPDALAVLAQSQIGQGRYEEAVGSAGRAIAGAPKHAGAHALRAIAYEQLGDQENALHDLRVAAAIDQDRFREPYEKARAGQRVFDPSRDDSWFLLEAIVPPARSAGSRGAGTALRAAAGALIGVLLLAAGGIALRRTLRRMSAEERRKMESTLKQAVQGQVLPKVRAETAPPPAAVDEPLYEKAVIAKKYQLRQRTAVDGEVQVWKAFDKTLARSVVIKRFPTEGRSPDSRTRLVEQIKSTATLHHPNIVDIFEILDRDSGLLVVYEYASGKTLRRVLEELGPLQFKQAREILIPVCRALEHAFRHGLNHGGLSPERIVLTPQGYVKVSDFVAARLLGATDDVYLAPEARGQGLPVKASDIYSVGSCLFEMLTGKRAMSAEDTASAGLPLAVRMLVVQLMEADAATRLASPIGVIQALQELPDE